MTLTGIGLLYDNTKDQFPPIQKVPALLSPPGEQNLVIGAFNPAENASGSNKQNTANLKGK